ncbi:unnamed protein product [marine sediment metagenome]|uniref:Uncharacterized protein n=1 Tax=marine sediment metagenome TaxID=412755 RepID=X0UIN1_9ZZZZ
MDTSEQFIKMCEKAEEIQEIADDYIDSFSISCWYSPNHVQCKGHFTDWHMGYKYCPVCRKPLKITQEYSICLRIKGDDTIWLPRQDQLQEMLFEGEYGLQTICARLYEWSTSASCSICFESMEQLQLGFWMRAKYNKVWNGEEWK